MRREIKKIGIILRNKGFLTVVKRSAAYLVKMLVYFPLCLLRMKDLRSRLEPPEAIDFVFSSCGGLLRPAQIRSEVDAFVEKVGRRRPKAILEIGTGAGGMLFLFTRIASSEAVLLSIDLPGAVSGGGYPRWKSPLYRSFGRLGQQIHLIMADSHSPETLEKVRRILGEQKIDLLFIDGDHSYRGVASDFEIYSPLVAEDGVIAFHDILPSPPDEGNEIEGFWNEIKHRYRFEEIIDNPTQASYGIGLLWSQPSA